MEVRYKSFLTVVILIILVHSYIFFSAVVYKTLESRSLSTKSKIKYAEVVLQKALQNGGLALKNSSSAEYKEFMGSFLVAIERDKSEEMKIAFGDLTKAYLFSLTTITTVGNSGMYLQAWSSRLFFIFSVVIGIILYAVMVHNVAILLLETFKEAAEMMCISNGRQVISTRNTFPKVQVILYCYGLLFIAVLILGLGGLFSGHTYIFGIYSAVDVLLTIGNQKWFTYLEPWNTITFVISMDLILMLEITLLYTTAYATLHGFKDSNWSDIVSFCWKDEDQTGYSPINQDDGDYHRLVKNLKTDHQEYAEKQPEPEYDDYNTDSFVDEPHDIPIGEGPIPTLLDPIEVEKSKISSDASGIEEEVARDTLVNEGSG